MQPVARRGEALAGALGLVVLASSALRADPTGGAPVPAAPSARPEAAPNPVAGAPQPAPSGADILGRFLAQERNQPVFAPSSVEAGARGGPPSDWSALLPFLGWTGFVLLLLGGALIGLRRLIPATRRRLGADAVRLLVRRNLSAQHTVYVVEVGPRLLVVGGSKTTLSALAEFREPDEIALVKALCPHRPDDSTAHAFHESLRSGLRQYERAPASPSAARRADSKAEIDEALTEIEDIKRMIASWK